MLLGEIPSFKITYLHVFFQKIPISMSLIGHAFLLVYTTLGTYLS